MITKAGVPSNRVVVGVTSYGRSFRMTTPGCYGPTCNFTGPSTGPEPGPCTGVADYLSNVEIKEIAGTNRVNYEIFDAASLTDILVYDDDQWVGWMSPTTKAGRIGIYQSYDLGGVSDWAVDLQDFQPSPIPEGWATFLKQINLYGNPYVEGIREGNWTDLDPAVEGVAVFTPNERWGMLDCNDASSDAITIWRTIDNVTGSIGFFQSVSGTYQDQATAGCDVIHIDGTCDVSLECTDTVGEGTGPAGYLVLISLIGVHLVRIYDAEAQPTTQRPGRYSDSTKLPA